MMAGAVETFDGWQGLAACDVDGADAVSTQDFELAQRAARGDMSAFEEVYRQHHRRVYGLCMRMTCNVSEAEDLTQEVFINLFRKLGSFRGEAALGTWIHRMTVNQVLMHFRRNKARREQSAEETGVPVRVVEGTERPGRMPVIDNIALSDAITKLPQGYRMVFILHDVEGYDHEEVGRLLGCAAGTSKSQLHKARKKLRELLSARPRRL